jgi:outer membrane protein assembly complex protein YaeT
VQGIEFDGATSYSSRELRQPIETSTYVWLLRRGDLDEERLDRDAASLTDYYRNQGFLDAEVGYELDFADNRSDLTVRFIVDEGVRYRVKSITFVGASVYPRETLLEGGPLEEGEYFVDEELRGLLKRVEELYWSSGYINASVRSDWVYSAEPELVDLTITIREGDQFRFGRVIIRGNENTQDRVIRRGLPFFPGDLYDRPKTEDAQRRLMETRLFDEATITPSGDGELERDALVNVTEGDSTNIIFGVGVTSNSGVIGSVMYENRNFDLFDRPRNWDEFFKGRSYRGAGQTLRLNLEPGTELSRFRIDFREPYIFDQPYGYNLSAYYFERGFKEYDIRRAGFTTSFDHRFTEGPLRYWAAEIAFRAENVDIGGLDLLSDRDFRAVEDGSCLTSIKGSVTRNTTDSLFLPSKGSRFTASWEQYGAMGGDYYFAKTIVDYARFFTLKTDEFNRKHVLALGSTVGNIHGDAPTFERFTGGGLGSIRGFDFRGVSPRGGKWPRDDERLGGDFMLLANAEYSFPLVGETIRGVTFIDMGTVEESVEISTWRAAAGVGARIYIPYFGPIPISIDFAWPLNKDSEDDTRVFSFSIGTSF